MTFSFEGSVRTPKIYVYTVDPFKNQEWVGGRPGKGLLKVGYTDRNVDERINEQLNAIKLPKAVQYDLLLAETSLTEDGLQFSDHDVHKVLERAGISRSAGEWFECTVEEVRAAIDSLKFNSNLSSLKAKVRFDLRPEQVEAVKVTSEYFKANASKDHPPHFLWNAKMRFGKTFTSYQLAKAMGWNRILVLTYKPAVAGAWRDDLELHEDFNGWRFKGKDDPLPDLNDHSPLVWFSSFQDALGVGDAGKPKQKNESLHSVEWDVVIIDEYHFGAWREAARHLYLSERDLGLEGDTSEKDYLNTPDLDDDFKTNLENASKLKVANYLYLSGTPFRALTEGEFLENQVFNWTYGQEQSAKRDWKGNLDNPYRALPRMNLLAYEMPDSLKQVAINNASEFSLTEFFRTEALPDKSGFKFVHEFEVQRWLDVLRGQDITSLWNSVSGQNRPPLPYEDLNLLRALQHTVWYLPSVSSCLAMKELLARQHNVFYRDYEIIVAAGKNAGVGEKALPPVMKAIGAKPQNSKTITLSCGKLMTGVTVPAWTGIFMLRELKSPESYFQAAFRVQSPWTTRNVDALNGGIQEFVYKQECYVLDFSPNRALRQIVDYATKLNSDLISERDQLSVVSEFMEFLPVLGFDGSSMNQLNAQDVIQYLTKGISASALARRWNSKELIKLDIRSIETLLSNKSLMESLDKIEMFRGLKDDLTALISTNKELSTKKLTKQPLSEYEKKIKDEATERRENLKEKLRKFVTRIPAFMYLTDDREMSIRDIILQQESELFQIVTKLSLSDFKQLVDAKVFDDLKMEDAVRKFKTYEDSSLIYSEDLAVTPKTGGWI